MTARQQVYGCQECGQMTAVVHPGGGRLVCCGKPMTLAGEGAGADVGTKRRVRSEPAQQAAPTAGAPYWKCSGCKYVLQAAQPPETCPSCREHCQFVDVSCYIPECGFTGADARLV